MTILFALFVLAGHCAYAIGPFGELSFGENNLRPNIDDTDPSRGIFTGGSYYESELTSPGAIGDAPGSFAPNSFPIFHRECKKQRKAQGGPVNSFTDGGLEELKSIEKSGERWKRSLVSLGASLMKLEKIAVNPPGAAEQQQIDQQQRSQLPRKSLPKQIHPQFQQSSGPDYGEPQHMSAQPQPDDEAQESFEQRQPPYQEQENDEQRQPQYGQEPYYQQPPQYQQEAIRQDQSGYVPQEADSRQDDEDEQSGQRYKRSFLSGKNLAFGQASKMGRTMCGVPIQRQLQSEPIGAQAFSTGQQQAFVPRQNGGSFQPVQGVSQIQFGQGPLQATGAAEEAKFDSFGSAQFQFDRDGLQPFGNAQDMRFDQQLSGPKQGATGADIQGIKKPINNMFPMVQNGVYEAKALPLPPAVPTDYGYVSNAGFAEEFQKPRFVPPPTCFSGLEEQIQFKGQLPPPSSQFSPGVDGFTNFQDKIEFNDQVPRASSKFQPEVNGFANFQDKIEFNDQIPRAAKQFKQPFGQEQMSYAPEGQKFGDIGQQVRPQMFSQESAYAPQKTLNRKEELGRISQGVHCMEGEMH